MLDLINMERARVGLPALQVDPTLVRLARLKSEDMVAKGYFGHISPTYGSPFAMMEGAGVKYRYAAENLAGAPAVDIAHRALMASPGHRANILSPHLTHAGIGIARGGPYGYMYTQMFIGR
ncbi:MAG: CAP domain-containing protein [Bacillota bacterium]